MYEGDINIDDRSCDRATLLDSYATQTVTLAGFYIPILVPLIS
jgi:hypothetical protein